MGKNVTPKQRIALEVLLTGTTVKDAADRAGVSRKTVYRWLKDPTFRATLDAATKDALNNLSLRVVALGNKAADAP
jgi:transposase